MFSQAYQQFPTDSAIWRQTSIQRFAPLTEVWEYQYFISGDTVLTGKTFHKVYKTGNYSGYTDSGWGSVLTYGPVQVDSNRYVGSLREDNMKHVYFIDDTASAEQLLYDFNLTVGDTLIGMYNQGYMTDTVYSIDSVLLNSVYHKRYRFYDAGFGGYYGAIIEGMGSTSGLLEKIEAPFEHIDYLRCFTRNEITIYTDSSFTSCEVPSPLGVTEKSNIAEMTVFPNPGSGEINIYFFPNQKAEIILCNVLGEPVYTTTLTGTETRLNLREIPKGIYFLQAFSDNGLMASKKLILQ